MKGVAVLHRSFGVLHACCIGVLCSTPETHCGTELDSWALPLLYVMLHIL